MGQLLVRNVPDEVVRGLKALAGQHGRSVEAEHRAILDEAVRAGLPTSSKAQWLARLAAHREATRGRGLAPSEVLVREMRDER